MNAKFRFALCLAMLTAAAAALPAAAGEVVLQDQQLLAAFDTDSGALTRLEDRTSGWVLERRPQLGVSFRLFAPLPNRRYNPVLGQKQHAGQVQKLSDHELRLQWTNLASENGGVLPITLTAVVGLTNGALSFDATLQNDSPLTVETVDFPYLGDLNPPTRQTPLTLCVMRNRNGNPDNLNSEEFYPHFRNEKGYWGVFYPLKTREAQQSPMCLIQSPSQGLLVLADPPYRLQYTFELHPGVISSINNLVPQQDEISGIPVHLEFRTCHFLFAHPHSTVKLAPVVLRCYQGGSQAGVDLYKKWHSTSAR